MMIRVFEKLCHFASSFGHSCATYTGKRIQGARDITGGKNRGWLFLTDFVKIMDPFYSFVLNFKTMIYSTSLLLACYIVHV